MNQKTTGMAIFLFLMATMLITAITWPWILHFDGELIRHWDPPFHAWKLELMARRILSGDPFFFNRETTILYPNTGTLYFEALQWPPSLFAALLFGVTKWSPEYIYQVTMLVFWALSAPCMFLFLRSLRISHMVSATAALAFCILPYRISYVNEFQMQLAFGTPLFFAAILHFFRKPCFKRGILVSVALWLYAITELNQAVFILFTLPFIATSLIVSNRSLVKSRGFWYGMCGAVVAGAALIFILLLPYAIQHSGGAVVRDLEEVDRHSVQVFSFLRPFGKYHFWTFDAKVEEWQAYPTLAMSFLCLLWLGAMARASFRDTACPKWRRLAPIPLLLSVGSFFSLSALFQCGVGINSAILVKLWRWIPVVCAVSAVTVCLSAGGETCERRLLWAFFGAGVFLAFLTIGPTLSLLREGRLFATGNLLYLALYRYGPFLKGFRAACRFGVFVHFFMLVAAAMAIDVAMGRVIRQIQTPVAKRLTAEAIICSGFLASIFIEAIPPGKLMKTMPIDNADSFPVIQRMMNRTDPFSLAVFPMGHRTYDGMTMFTILKNRFNSFYAWCGYVPPETEAVCAAARRGDFSTVCEELSTLWPECLLLVDRSKPIQANPGYVKSLPSHVAFWNGRHVVDYAAALSDEAMIIDSDDRFVLLSLKPRSQAKKFTKKFRSDYAKQKPIAHFSLTLTRETADVAIRFNEESIAHLRNFAGSEIEIPLPTDKVASHGYNVLEIELDNEAVLDAFRLEQP